MRKGFGFFFSLAILIIIGGAFAYMVQTSQAPMPGSATDPNPEDSCAVPGGG